jgi:hypothetical protein
MVMGFKCGQIKLGMRASGQIIEQAEKENFIMPTETYLMEFGLMIKHQGMECMCMLMEILIKDTGSKICNMVSG